MPAVVGLLEEHELTARRRVAALRKEADRFQAELVVAGQGPDHRPLRIRHVRRTAAPTHPVVAGVPEPESHARVAEVDSTPVMPYACDTRASWRARRLRHRSSYQEALLSCTVVATLTRSRLPSGRRYPFGGVGVWWTVLRAHAVRRRLLVEDDGAELHICAAVAAARLQGKDSPSQSTSVYTVAIELVRLRGEYAGVESGLATSSRVMQ